MLDPKRRDSGITRLINVGRFERPEVRRVPKRVDAVALACVAIVLGGRLALGVGWHIAGGLTTRCI